MQQAGKKELLCVETLEVGTKKLGAEEKARRKKCEVGRSSRKSYPVGKLHEEWIEKTVEDKFGS